ncbi:hypothetical protein P4E94_15340 [Pontiellaceae bacterium B12219]|nr:hypothetical protein [Pontiellaceae bacterium B12219]
MMKKMGIILGVIACVALVFILKRNKLASVSEEKPDERIALLNTSRTAEGPAQDSIKPDVQAITSADDSVKTEPKELSDPVKSLLLQDDVEHNYPSLLAEINKLNYALSGADVAALIEMLAWPNDRFPEGMRPIEINAVKNDVLDKLLRQETLSEGIGIAMAAMAADPGQDDVWRDYCVQFMAPFYERKSQVNRSKVVGRDAGGAMASATEGSEATAAPIELDVIREAMFQALDERDSSIAGTALLGLENLSRTYDEFDREVISEKAAQIASDELASAESRMTALRLSAQILNREGISNVEVVQAARTLAQTGDTVLLRSAAIVTLGEVGSTDDLELLESYVLADNRQIAGAAKMALEKMSARN